MPSEDQAQLDRVKSMIRDAGLRCTSSRATVLAFLIDASVPMSHADLVDKLVPQGLDQATIYRNLTDLTENGLLYRLDPGDHIWRFEFRGTSEHGDEHPHFLCNDCGEISCLSSVDINVADSEHGASSVGEIDEIFLRGRCARCT